jgi:ribosomal protein S18 acetylase RimI-like enzyme
MRRELRDGFELDDDPSRIDLDAVHAFISQQSYWGRGRPRELLERSVRGSTRVLGLYHGAEQVGFARAVSDGAIVGYLADVYVLPEHRGRGLGLELVREIVDGSAGGVSSEVRWLLHTDDAQGLYAKLGFTDEKPRYGLMERARSPARTPARPRPAGAVPTEPPRPQ